MKQFSMQIARIKHWQQQETHQRHIVPPTVIKRCAVQCLRYVDLKIVPHWEQICQGVNWRVHSLHGERKSANRKRQHAEKTCKTQSHTQRWQNADHENAHGLRGDNQQKHGERHWPKARLQRKMTPAVERRKHEKSRYTPKQSLRHKFS